MDNTGTQLKTDWKLVEEVQKLKRDKITNIKEFKNNFGKYYPELCEELPDDETIYEITNFIWYH